MKIDGYFLMQGVIIVFQVGLALFKYCEDDLVCFLTLIYLIMGWRFYFLRRRIICLH
jgi:hypothetical protein